MKIIERPVKRLFTFGCSFTNYFWSTWPEVIAYDLDIPLYNYGQSGAGNQYIANMICQADNIYKFDEDDLIIVSWTNVAREDRWVNGQWITPGNIYSQGIYDQKFVEKWSDPVGYLVRDLASIKSTKIILEKVGCQFHFFSMCDITYQFNQNSNSNNIVPDQIKSKYESLCLQYKRDIDFILPSFYKILWDNDINRNKFSLEKELGYNFFQDGHPYPEEHFRYLSSIFNSHEFNDRTLSKIKNVQNNFREFIRQKSDELKRYWAIYELGKEANDKLIELVQIKKSEFIEKI
jgi:hypothetical protein